MKSFLNSVKLTKPPRNTFDTSHPRGFSMNMGHLVPSLVKEVVASGTYTGSSSQVFRLAPMVAPIMSMLNVRTETFFSPNRLVWNGWESFITGQSTLSVPYIVLDFEVEAGSLLDFLKVPVGDYTGLGTKINAMPIAHVVFIWNNYYRDENLQNELLYQLSPGDNTALFAPLDINLKSGVLRRCWEPDLFTKALPFRQKGNPVTIPVLGNAPISFINPTTAAKAVPVTGGVATAGNLHIDGLDNNIQDGANIDVSIDNSLNLEARLDLATATTINDLRVAYRIQEWLERNALGGTRYTEWIRAHFGLTPQDSRLQRPEFLGSSVAPITISEVLQTSETGSTPLGDYAGHGIHAGQSRNFYVDVQEHGFIISFVSVLPKTMYFQGLPKFYNKFDKFDYLDPIFAHLGEDAILNQEVQAFHANPRDAFGYQRKYYEYCTGLGSVHGDMATTALYWHAARDLPTNVELNSDFVSADPTFRIFAVTDSTVDHLYCHMWHANKDTLPLPKYGTPSGG